MRRQKYKPGPGWHYYGLVPVYEHETGVRVHSAGMYRTPTGDITEIPYSDLSKYRRICAGKKNRAVMAWVRDNIL